MLAQVFLNLLPLLSLCLFVPQSKVLRSVATAHSFSLQYALFFILLLTDFKGSIRCGTSAFLFAIIELRFIHAQK